MRKSSRFLSRVMVTGQSEAHHDACRGADHVLRKAEEVRAKVVGLHAEGKRAAPFVVHAAAAGDGPVGARVEESGRGDGHSGCAAKHVYERTEGAAKG